MACVGLKLRRVGAPQASTSYASRTPFSAGCAFLSARRRLCHSAAGNPLVFYEDLTAQAARAGGYDVRFAVDDCIGFSRRRILRRRSICGRAAGCALDARADYSGHARRRPTTECRADQRRLDRYAGRLEWANNCRLGSPAAGCHPLAVCPTPNDAPRVFLSTGPDATKLSVYQSRTVDVAVKRRFDHGPNALQSLLLAGRSKGLRLLIGPA
jgi:hypothetical protein